MNSGGAKRREAIGQIFTWLCGGALALNLLLIVGLLVLLVVNGAAYFWQSDLVRFRLTDGTVLLGIVFEEEDVPDSGEGGELAKRFRLGVGNRDLGGADFRWIEEKDVVSAERPADAVLLERLEWGNFYGSMRELRRQNEVLAEGERATWEAFGPLHEAKLRELGAIQDLEHGEIARLNTALERLRLAERRLELAQPPEPERSARAAELNQAKQRLQAEYDETANRLVEMRQSFVAETLVMQSADGRTKEIPVGHVVRAVQPNALGFAGRLQLYLARFWEFVSADPRESNTEGGIFPAIFGTVMMVFLMAAVVAPFGVVAAVYLREYATEGFLVRLVRIAVNNLAGVPSIVFGVFGLGFFVYLVGGSIDQLFYPEALPAPTFGTGGILWASLTLALLTVPVVVVASEEGLAAVPRNVREGSLALGATKFETLRSSRPARCSAGHPHGHHPRHGARSRRGSAAHDRGYGQARTHPAGGRKFPFRASRAQVHASRLPHLRRGLPEPKRGSREAPGLRHGAPPHPGGRGHQPGRHPAPQSLAGEDVGPDHVTTVTSGPAPNATVALEKPVFGIENLWLYYGSAAALQDISIAIPERKITAFIGPSGCGKSTLLRCLNRMNDLVDNVRIEGRILFHGLDLGGPEVDVNELRKRIGMVFQKSNPFPKSIFENVAYGPRIHGVNQKDRLDEIVEKSLRGAALWDEVKDRLDDTALGLSGGQQQRLCIARAIAVEPEVILLDEPCSALDPIATAKVEELMQELKQRYTLVVVTHNMQQAARVSDYTAFLYLGRLIEFGETAKLFVKPQQRQTEDYITGRFG